MKETKKEKIIKAEYVVSKLRRGYLLKPLKEMGEVWEYKELEFYEQLRDLLAELKKKLSK